MFIALPFRSVWEIDVQSHASIFCLTASRLCPASNVVLQGVGVGLFRDRACAVEACNKLSGAQADGRKLELVLMNPDNHVSFSCRQVGLLVHRFTAVDLFDDVS